MNINEIQNFIDVKGISSIEFLRLARGYFNNRKDRNEGKTIEQLLSEYIKSFNH
jgi:hypothetical protein